MIKNWKLFLESNNNFNIEREIFSNIKDILLSIKDNVDYIKVYIPKFVEEFGKIKLHFTIEGNIGIEEIREVSHLNSYLISEDFEPGLSRGVIIQNRNKNELNISTQLREGGLYQYSIDNLIQRLEVSDSIFNKYEYNISRILFAYYLPTYINGYIFKRGNIIEL